MDPVDTFRDSEAERELGDDPIGRLDDPSGRRSEVCNVGSGERGSEERSSGRFNLHAKNLGLTYPQNQCQPEECLDNIKAYFGENLEWAVVCRELHEDGSPHLHCAIRTKKKIHIRNASVLDCLSRSADGTVRHGNYQAVRSLRKWLTYVLKDDNYVQYGIDAKSFTNKKGSKYAQAVDMIIGGSDLNKVFAEDPGTWARHYTELSRIRDKVISTMHQSQTISVGVLQMLAEEVTGVTQTVALWMQMSLKQEIFPRRSQQLYLVGAPMTGS